jgi:DNA uptake protein ComE-like DNA-binding protein
MTRPNPTGVRSNAELSAAKIEEMIEKKVQEALAHRALDQPAPNPPTDITEAVQRRLEALERKIENGEAEEARAEGLRFLLMAKQHKERGEDSSALKMYELAVPFFPGQEKLHKKIDNLRAKIQAKREEAARASAPVAESRKAPATTPIPLPSPPTSFEAPQEETHSKSRRKANADSDDEFNGSAVMQTEDYEDDDSFSYKSSKAKKSKQKSAPKSSLHIFADDTDGPLTPRTRHLLDIINSRDIAMIKGLSGVGAKKARDLVEFLELQNEDEGGNIRTLQQLIAVPGLGKRSVERAYEGVSALLV